MSESVSKDNMWEVEELVDRREERGQTMYLVKWRGWPSSFNTWESAQKMGPIPPSFLEHISNLKEEEILKDINWQLGSMFLKDNEKTKNLKFIAKNQTNNVSYGSLRFGDKPLKVLFIDIISDDLNYENCLVEWKERKNRVKPKNSIISITLLKCKYPNLLLEYYELAISKAINNSYN